MRALSRTCPQRRDFTWIGRPVAIAIIAGLFMAPCSRGAEPMLTLVDGANPWRGLIFGETARFPHSGDPRALWRAGDDFGIQGTEFLPFFLPDCPVKTDHADVLATAYRGPGRTLLALGSWAKTQTPVRLRIDWQALDLDAARASLYAPPITGMQSERIWKPDQPIPVEPQRGWFFVLDEVKREVTPAAPAPPPEPGS